MSQFLPSQEGIAGQSSFVIPSISLSYSPNFLFISPPLCVGNHQWAADKEGGEGSSQDSGHQNQRKGLRHRATQEIESEQRDKRSELCIDRPR
jgi:hypothetical protein